jgi:Periplasmic copper-binding protein (NosD)
MLDLAKGAIMKFRANIFQMLTMAALFVGVSLSIADAAEIVIDNAAPGVQDISGGRMFTGSWCASSAANGYVAGSLYSCGSAVDTYRWTPAIVNADQYDVYVWWSTHPNRSSTVPIAVNHADGSTVKNFDEKVPGGQWILHGRYRFTVGTTGFVQVSAANGQAAADAVRFVTAASPPPGEIFLDNASLGAQDVARTFSGAWCLSSATNSFGGTSLYSCGGGLESYRWTPTIATEGSYDVYAWWSTHPNRSTSVPITVTHADGNALKNFNEQSGGGQWVLHGRYRFVAGNTGYVQVTDANGQAAADAVRLVPAGSPPPPPPTSGAPAILFTDVEAGPVSGGSNNLGVPIAIFGKGFGTTRGTSKVTIGGVEVASYLIWGQNNANNSALDMIVVQPGAISTSGSVVVNVGGKLSNADHRFTPSGGKVYYVAPTGSDSAPCSETQPCATILHAVGNVMVAGDAVLVRGGTLNDDEIWLQDTHGHSGTRTKPKIIRNFPGEKPEFSVGIRPFALSAHYITISGIHFKNGKSLGLGGETESVVGNRIYNNTFRGVIDYDAIGTHGNDILLAGNDCDVPTSTQGTQGHCYYISAGDNIRLRYNIAKGAPGYGIHIFDQKRGQGADFKRVISNVLVEGNLLAVSPERSGMILAMGDEAALGNHMDGVTIRNNIFTANNFAGIAIGGNVRNVRVYHNTFYQNGRQGITIYDDPTISGIEITNNLFDQSSNTNCKANCSWYAPAHVEKGARAAGVTLTNNFYAPGPTMLIGVTDASGAVGLSGFVNAATGDYRLAAGSAAIDKGALLPSVITDFTGAPRAIGAKPDAGAFERQ